jgi:hypothetical protein
MIVVVGWIMVPLAERSTTGCGAGRLPFGRYGRHRTGSQDGGKEATEGDIGKRTHD